MDVLIRIFAAVTIIIGAMECFVGYRSIKSFPCLIGIIAGVSVGCAVGIISSSVIAGMVIGSLLGGIFGIGLYLWNAFGIIVIAICFGMVSGSLLFSNMIVGTVIGITTGIFTLFYYKIGTVISSSVFGSVVIVFSAFALMGEKSVSDEMLIYALVICALATVVGIACQFLTTIYDDFEQYNIFETIGDRAESESFSEKRYPGLQRAYRNYCIRCGSDISVNNGKCPRCGFNFDD